MNITKRNVHQLNNLVEFISYLGGDPKNIKISNVGYVGLHKADEEAIKYFTDNVISDSCKDFLNFYCNLDKKNTGMVPKILHCEFLTPTISYDFKYTICCQDLFGEVNLGDALRMPYKDMVKTEGFKVALKKLKAREYDMCKGCCRPLLEEFYRRPIFKRK